MPYHGSIEIYGKTVIDFNGNRIWPFKKVSGIIYFDKFCEAGSHNIMCLIVLGTIQRWFLSLTAFNLRPGIMYTGKSASLVV